MKKWTVVLERVPRLCEVLDPDGTDMIVTSEKIYVAHGVKAESLVLAIGEAKLEASMADRRDLIEKREDYLPELEDYTLIVAFEGNHRPVQIAQKGALMKKQYRCPDSVPADEPNAVIGCGKTFEAESDHEGLVDCPHCGIHFNPANPINAPQPDQRGIPDDTMVRVGNWLFHVDGEYAFVHHADSAKPGDIRIKAEAEGFVVDVFDDEANEVPATLSVEYNDLKGELL